MKAKHFANGILAGGGTLTLSAFFFLFYYYNWTGQRQFTRPLAGVAQYTGLACLSFLLFASLRLRPAFKIILALLCLSLTAGMYLAEILLPRSGMWPFWGLEQGSSTNKQAIRALEAAFGSEIDIRDRMELLTGLRQRQVDAVPAVMLGQILSTNTELPVSDEEAISIRSNGHMNVMPNELMPIGGVAGKLTILCNESGQYVTYESDEHGFRNPTEIWKSSHADMAALGESFVQGYCVRDGKNFVDLLRRRYPIALNLGMSGESSLLQLAAIKEYLAGYAPKVVLWFFCEGIDLGDLQNEAKHPLLMRYLEPHFDQHLLDRQPEIDHALRNFISETEERAREVRPPRSSNQNFERWLEIMKLSNLRQRLGMVYGIQSDDADVLSPSLLRTKQHLLSDALAQARALTNSWGGRLYFVYLPSWDRYGKDPRPAEIERVGTLELVRALGIPFIDVQPAFQAQRDPLALFPIRRFGHYNESGNKIVAETVLKFLSVREPAADPSVNQQTRFLEKPRLGSLRTRGEPISK